MDNLDGLLDLPIAALAAGVCFVVCFTTLLVILLTAPRRDCFFFRWRPEARLLALFVAPTLLILWPIVLYGWFLKSRGIGPEDLDYFDDD